MLCTSPCPVNLLEHNKRVEARACTLDWSESGAQAQVTASVARGRKSHVALSYVHVCFRLILLTTNFEYVFLPCHKICCFYNVYKKYSLCYTFKENGS